MHSVKAEKHYSHAEECAKFCRLDHFEGVKSNKKYNIRENERKIKDKYYHVTDKDTKMVGSNFKMKAKGFCTAETVELYSGMRAHYHIHADPNLGIGKVAV